MKEITVEATVDQIGAVTDFVEEELEAMNCPMKARMQIAIAIDELFGNIARYAYHPKTGLATVRLETEGNPPQAVVTFIDRGDPYNPLEQEAPDITLSAEERQIGGLGVFMVKKTMDGMEYEYRDGCNILSIRKTISV